MSSSPVVRTACLTLLALAAFLPLETAQAGRATVSGARLVYTDVATGAAEDPAEANDITLSAQDGALVLSEAGAGVAPVAGNGCTLAGTTLTCRTPNGSPFSAASINLGEGANRAAIAPSIGELPLSLAGGEGPDVLSGGPGSDRISGGGGDDVLQGGEGDDVLLGDEGADQLRGDGGLDDFFGDEGDDVLRAADGIDETLDCGSGFDRVEADASDRASSDCEMSGAASVLPGPSPDEFFTDEDPSPGVAGVAAGELLSLRVRSRCFFPGAPVSRARRPTCRHPTRGSALLVEATGPVNVVVGIQRVLRVTRRGTLCAAGSREAECRRYVRAALLKRSVAAGTTALGLSARPPAALEPGLYRAALSVDRAGKPTGRPLFAFFRVVAPPRPVSRAAQAVWRPPSTSR